MTVFSHDKNLKLFDFIKLILFKVPYFVDKVNFTSSSLTIYQNHIFNNPYRKNALIAFLKKHVNMQCEILIDITAIDYLTYNISKLNRFELVYQFLSLRYNYRVCFKTSINFLEMIQSTSILYNSANWLEREIWDLYGIFFSAHPDLRRILTDYGFQGFPLRKDYPLVGYTELRYNDEIKSIVYELVELSQEFRFFNFFSSWIYNY